MRTMIAPRTMSTAVMRWRRAGAAGGALVLDASCALESVVTNDTLMPDSNLRTG